MSDQDFQVEIEGTQIIIPKDLTKLFKMVIEKAYNEGYDQGYSDGKYGG